MNMFTHTHRRRSPLEEKRWKQKRIKFLFLIIIFVVVVIGLTHLEKISIQNIIITGVSDTKQKSILIQVQNKLSGKHFYIFPKKNILLIPRDDIKDTLYKENPFIKNIDISLVGLDELSVKITQRESQIIWCSKEDVCFFLDEGLIYEKVIEKDFSKYIILRTEKELDNIDPTLGAIIIDPSKIRKVYTFVSYLEREGTDVLDTLIKDVGDFVIQTELGAQILFNNEQDVSEVIEALSSVIDSGVIAEEESVNPYIALLYIDLRFGKKIFYKFK